uniref:Short transient receptor potential channel 4-like n=1 Tax=Saccoglossus kowalevskii TaxID=10224 RepID=A0ABM0M2V5_SACKO|nr:PREDICTED: short transient receptor potential channel 4-like [Saccoglossus kowalevskii]
MEKLYLTAAEKGDKKAMKLALEYARGLDINCTDASGRSALILAIQNGSTAVHNSGNSVVVGMIVMIVVLMLFVGDCHDHESLSGHNTGSIASESAGSQYIIKLLLAHNVALGDALLRAVDMQIKQIVDLICEYIKKRKKKFVTHPNTQQLLIEKWFKGLPNWRELSGMKSFLFTILFGLCFPVFSVAYTIAPQHKFSHFLKIPFVKFVCNTASSFAFLVLLGMQTIGIDSAVAGENKQNEERYEKLQRENRPSALTVQEWLIVFWIVGMTWEEIAIVLKNGSRVITDNLQMKILDYSTLLLFWGWIGLRFALSVQVLGGTKEPLVASVNNGTPVLVYIDDGGNTGDVTIKMSNGTMLPDYITTDQMLTQMTPLPFQKIEISYADIISRAFFAVAKVFSFMRLIRITVVNQQVGPMQISLGRMFQDIAKFMMIFCLVWLAFSIGLNQLYWFHALKAELQCNMAHVDDCKEVFSTMGTTMNTLFWAIFGVTKLDSLEIYGNDRWFVEGVGQTLYGAYHVIGIIVLLNILIAMMTKTYTTIEEDADIQWKYSRAELWMSYFGEGAALPPPFNLLPSRLGVEGLIRRFKHGLCTTPEHIKLQQQSMIETKVKEYEEVIHDVVRRYHFEKQRDEEEDVDPWLVQLKQDISGFKYDMFEALGDMDNKINHVQAKVEDRDVIESSGPGSEMFHLLADAVASEPRDRYADLLFIDDEDDDETIYSMSDVPSPSTTTALSVSRGTLDNQRV